MGYSIDGYSPAGLWALAEAQHGVVARRQLLERGMHPQAVKHRLATGRLHRLWPGVYAVGRPGVTRRGRWMAATLACRGILAGESAAALAAMGDCERRLIEVIVPPGARTRLAGISPREAQLLAAHVGAIDGIPVTSPARTLLDLARTRSRHDLETAINEAVKLDLIDPETLRAALGDFAGVAGAAALRATLDVRTFVLTEAGVERHFLPIAYRAGLSRPLTQQWVNGFLVDFLWPALGLVVETDGLRFHRTAAKQAADLRRQQTHLAAGLWPLRFSHGQVRFEKGYVEATLADMLERIRRSGTPGAT
jgi:very-short-patch-repair endonuclease